MPSAPEAASESPAAQGFAAWSKNKSDPRFTDWLRELSEPTWTQATEHRFTRELADDTLDDAVFRHYLVQDYSFVDRFVSLLGFAIGRAPSLAERIRLSRFLDAVTSEENTYFQRSFDTLGVSDRDRTEPELAPPTRGFHELMKEASEAGSYEEILAVLVVAEWLYLSWATAVKDCSPSKFYFAEWIELHAGDTFQEFVEWLRGQLDRHGPVLSPERRETVVELFLKAVRLEKEFFDAAYEQDA